MKKSEDRSQDIWFELILEDQSVSYVSHPNIYPQHILSSQVQQSYQLQCNLYGRSAKKILSHKRISYHDYLLKISK